MPGSGRRVFTCTKAAARAVAVSTAVAAAGFGHRVRYVEPYKPVLERVDIHVPDGITTPPRLRIGFVADTHIGPVIRPADVDRAMSCLLAADPDLLLFGGDYVCESPRHIPDAAEVLGNYASATRLGAVAVLGNHDYSNGASKLTALFERRGIQVLRNEATRVADSSGELWIAGIDDMMLGSPDPQQAFASVQNDARALALWHEPDWAEPWSRLAPSCSSRDTVTEVRFGCP